MTPTPARTRAGAQLGQRLAPRAQHGQALLEEPGVHLAVGVDEVGADEARRRWRRA